MNKKNMTDFLRRKDSDGISLYHGGVFCSTIKYDEVDVVRAMQDFASQESKRAVEKDRESRWISVKDKKPSSKDPLNPYVSDEVIVFSEGRVQSGYYRFVSNRFHCSEYNDAIDNVTHWQPLPEPPKL